VVNAMQSEEAIAAEILAIVQQLKSPADRLRMPEAAHHE